jgi:hypothetical protein
MLLAGYVGWYAGTLHVHHPVTGPARHRLFWRLAARNRISVAYRNLPGPLIPPYLTVWTALTLTRALRGGGLRESLKGMREGWTSRHAQDRRPMSWRTAWRLTKAGRPPII